MIRSSFLILKRKCLLIMFLAKFIQLSYGIERIIIHTILLSIITKATITIRLGKQITNDQIYTKTSN